MFCIQRSAKYPWHLQRNVQKKARCKCKVVVLLIKTYHFFSPLLFSLLLSLSSLIWNVNRLLPQTHEHLSWVGGGEVGERHFRHMTIDYLFQVILRKRLHLATPPVNSLWNDVQATSVEIPYWWCVTTQIWVALLIGPVAREICFNQLRALPRSG